MKNQIKLTRAFVSSSYEDYDTFLHDVNTLLSDLMIAKLTSHEIADLLTTYLFECRDSFYNGYNEGFHDIPEIYYKQ